MSFPSQYDNKLEEKTLTKTTKLDAMPLPKSQQ